MGWEENWSMLFFISNVCFTIVCAYRDLFVGVVVEQSANWYTFLALQCLYVKIFLHPGIVPIQCGLLLKGA